VAVDDVLEAAFYW